MRILHVIIDLKTGGAELMLKRLLAATRDEPGTIHRVVSLRGLGTVGPQLQAMGIEVDALGLGGAIDLPLVAARLTARIRRARPDVVQCWMYHADLVGGLAARAAGCRAILWGVRIADISPEMGVSPTTLVIRRLCARLSRLVPTRIVYVAASARGIHERLGYDPAKSVVIPNGYDLPPLPSAAEREAIRAGLGAAPEDVLIGSAGRFNAQKDHKSFVAAAAEVAAARPRARFILCGRDVEPSTTELAEWVEASGQAGRFSLLGERRDLPRLLPAFDLVAMHSIGEGFPNVVAEAMAAGVPCAVTDVGDAALLVADTGLVVPPADPARMAAALIELIDRGPDARAALGARARQRIADEYSLEAIAGRYRRLYSEIAPAATGKTD